MPSQESVLTADPTKRKKKGYHMDQMSTFNTAQRSYRMRVRHSQRFGLSDEHAFVFCLSMFMPDKGKSGELEAMIKYRRILQRLHKLATSALVWNDMYNVCTSTNVRLCQLLRPAPDPDPVVGKKGDTES